MMITVSAPGKLMLSGEWSVLERDVPCIVLAVDKRVFVSIREADKITIKLRDFGITTDAYIERSSIIFEEKDESLLFTKFAIDTALKYLQEKQIPIKNFELETHANISTISNEETGEEVKIGFGSSAAAVVAIIAALLKLHEVLSLTDEDTAKLKEKEIIFKLGIIAHYLGQGKLGSGFDVAASTFGGALVYKRFDPQWLEKALREKSMVKVIEEKWPLLEHWNIPLPSDFELFVAFTGTSASTRKLVRQIKLFKEEDPDEYHKIILAIKNVTEKLIVALSNAAKKEILALLDRNRELLEDLSNACECHLEIEAHQIMSDIAAEYGAVAKFSGAGGGDCSIGVCFDKITAKKILEEWENKGFVPIDVKITAKGLYLH
ncbi:MAG: phosphomevalonate kinase [Promethearchaeota archaeon]